MRRQHIITAVANTLVLAAAFMVGRAVGAGLGPSRPTAPMVCERGVIYPLVLRERGEIIFLVDRDGQIMQRGKVIGRESALAATLLVAMDASDLSRHGVREGHKDGFGSFGYTALSLGVSHDTGRSTACPLALDIATVEGPLPPGPLQLGALDAYLADTPGDGGGEAFP